MRTRNLFVLPFTLGLLFSFGRAQEPQTLQPGRSVERNIAGDETHSYQIFIESVHSVRVRLQQRVIDAALTLTAADGKQLAEVDLTGAGEEEPLSLEVAATGSYRLTVRGVEAVTRRGSYRLEA